MPQSSFKPFYRRTLPHIHLPEARYFITFRLANSLPKDVAERLRLELEEALKRPAEENPDAWWEKQWMYLTHFDQLSDASHPGSRWLSKPEIAGLVIDAIRFYDGRTYDLLCCTVMSNHVHLLIDHTYADSGKRIDEILQSIKKYTARKANILLGRTGERFWHHESYDHIVRSDRETEATIRYILNNPVKAGLCKHWQEWDWTYLKEAYRSFYQ